MGIKRRQSRQTDRGRDTHHIGGCYQGLWKGQEMMKPLLAFPVGINCISAASAFAQLTPSVMHRRLEKIQLCMFGQERDIETECLLSMPLRNDVFLGKQ